ncbi:uncharacterized protein C8A04DRAFT_13483 [Dichotomopilus funicola]|uniref:Uncharacterized protein n=1 Tax=Dichotomopilus funicola TaxID=1934379 RepID=A0AAN6ZLL6_9PEZI|nr:hypothetical protein C8A04DRAFT_13483 [Dichotomopilus funicola]
MAAMEAANAHYHNGHQQSGLPASPTLTNPDMILPDYDRSDSPEASLDGPDHASLMMWKNTHNNPSGAGVGPDMHNMFVATGMAGPRPYGPSGPMTPTTPIIYGNGTMLSDIGEVTEVESTVGKPSPGRARPAFKRQVSPRFGGSGNDTALQSSPTINAASSIKKKSKQNLKGKQQQHERRSSIESTSTVTNGEPVAAFADFDDSVSVGDSVFQGDDEESMASSYVDGTAAMEPGRLGVTKVDSADRLSTYSTTSISRRAEEILANAKKRLTTMEGNLTRARSSLHYHSPYGSDASTPSPKFQRGSTAVYTPDNHDAANPTSPPPEHASGHTRMSSDVAMRNGLPYRVSFPRSQSALGAAGGYRQPLTASKSADQIRGDADETSGRPISKAHSVREGGLKPLTEDEVARLGEADSASHNARLAAYLSPAMDSPTFGSFHSDGGMRQPQRSSSAAQMRDIKDQMRDLKGKISSLREQARVDSVKRQSMQSLRTPSPFTHSQIDHWYEPPSNRASQIMTGEYPEHGQWHEDDASVDGGLKEAAQRLEDSPGDGEETDYADAEEGTELGHEPEQEREQEEEHENGYEHQHGQEHELDDDDLRTENGDTEDHGEAAFHDPAEEDYDLVSESGESLYHDSVQHQISHEDREDAFDYEHFFLHSAMGTMSMARRASEDSYTSDDSVETTRGPLSSGNDTSSHDEQHPPQRPRLIGRRSSSNSISTIDTFATAQESRSLKSPVSPDEFHSFYDASSRAASVQSHHRFRSGSSAATKRSSHTPSMLHPPTQGPVTRDSDGSISPIAEESSTAGSPAAAVKRPPVSSPSPSEPDFPSNSRRNTIVHRPISTATITHASLHRPSTASFESVGTNRSFPLVNRPGSRPRSEPPSPLSPTSPGFPNSSTSSIANGNGNANGTGNDMNTIASRLMSDMGLHAAHASISTDGGTFSFGPGNDSPNNGDSSPQPHPLEALLREDKYLVERVVADLGKCVLGLTENGRASAESRMFRRRLDAARRALEGLDC